MIEPSTPTLPHGLSTSFTVVGSEGLFGRRTWLLRDDGTGVQYRVTSDSVADWDLPLREESLPSSIILSLSVNGSVTVLHLATGEVYRTGAYAGIRP